MKWESVMVGAVAGSAVPSKEEAGGGAGVGKAIKLLHDQAGRL